MEVEEWIEDEELIEDSWMELEKARGEKVIRAKKKSKNPLKTSFNSINELTIIFEDTDNLDIEDTYGIKINGRSIIAGQTQ